MLGKVATVVGYAKAPKATFVLRHPVRGTKALIAARKARGVVARRLGAAAGALIVGVAAYRATRGRSV